MNEAPPSGDQLFTCAVCAFSCHYSSFGRCERAGALEVQRLVFKEDVYQRTSGEARVCVGAHCAVCAARVCVREPCSIYYARRICKRCAAAAADLLPAEVVAKLDLPR